MHDQPVAITATITTPDGPFTIIVSDAVEAVLASGWTGVVDELLPLIHPTLRPSSLAKTATSPALNRSLDAVRAYYDGDYAAIDKVPVTQRSGPFRQHSWQVLRTVPPGQTWTYTEYAAEAGRPLAVRAAADACAKNAAALFVPCHRILRADGTLGGFRYGLDIKQSLLAREKDYRSAVE